MRQDKPLLADELEAFLAAQAGGHATPALVALPRAEAALATNLLTLSGATQPDPTFADALEAELRTKAAKRPISTTPSVTASGSERSAAWRRRGQGLSSRLPRRWPAWVAAALLLLTALLFVPPVEATVQAVIQIGVDHIFRTPPAHTPTSRTPTPTPLASVLDLAGETTLAQAQKQVQFPIRLPAYPWDLGPPQRVFLQDLGGAAVVLVWLDPQHAGAVRMSLHELSQGIYVYKSQPQVIQETSVHGQRAIWTDGPYIVQVVQGGRLDYAPRRLVTGHVLIWTEGDITYRLETSASLEEAVRIAESLH